MKWDVKNEPIECTDVNFICLCKQLGLGWTRTRLDRKIVHHKTFSHLGSTRILRVLNLFCTLYTPLQYKPKQEQCERRFPAANNTQMRFCKELHIITDPSIKPPACHLNKQIPFTQAEHARNSYKSCPGVPDREGKEHQRVQCDESFLLDVWKFFKDHESLAKRAFFQSIASKHITVALRSNFSDGYRWNMVFWITYFGLEGSMIQKQCRSYRNINAFHSQRKSLGKSLASG